MGCGCYSFTMISAKPDGLDKGCLMVYGVHTDKAFR